MSDLKSVNDFSVSESRRFSRLRLYSDSLRVAHALPTARYALNLCEDRYLFTVMLLAAAQRGQISVLPQARLPLTLAAIIDQFPDSYLAYDRSLPFPGAAAFRVGYADCVDPVPVSTPCLDDAEVMAFTSGSTGTAKASVHRFGAFRASAAMALRALDLAEDVAMLVSTTPPQHMFGLETSVFWPLFSGLLQYAGRPFFPADIAAVLETAPDPCVLATTPTHLAAVQRTGTPLPNLRAVVCSTASLAPELAAAIEEQCAAPVLELYGSTETLSFAVRRPAFEQRWRLYDSVTLVRSGRGRFAVRGPHLELSVNLADRFRRLDERHFEWLGRAGDLVKVGGKRASLRELNRRLLGVPGVMDGFMHAYRDAMGETRLAAVVVGSVSKKDLLQALQPWVDEVFLPKRMHRVEGLPRNEAGKLTREARESLLQELGYPKSQRSGAEDAATTPKSDTHSE